MKPKEKYNERLKQIGYKIKYRDESYIDGYLDSAEPREAQLVKAKKLLNKWLYFHAGHKDYPSPLQSETEQFLSGVEK